MKVRLRTAVAADVDAIRDVGAATWPATYAFAGDDYVAHGLATWWSEEATLRTLRETHTLVAVVDGEVVGVGNLDLRRDPAVIWKLYVLPAAHGTGVGAALLDALVQAARDGGASAVALEYVDGNARAAGFYRRHGFAETSREPSAQPGWPDTVWLRREL